MIHGLMFSITDDLFSQVLYSITCALVIACSFDGAGQYSKYLTADQIEDGTKVSPPKKKKQEHIHKPSHLASPLTPKHFQMQ